MPQYPVAYRRGGRSSVRGADFDRPGPGIQGTGKNPANDKVGSYLDQLSDTVSDVELFKKLLNPEQQAMLRKQTFGKAVRGTLAGYSRNQLLEAARALGVTYLELLQRYGFDPASALRDALGPKPVVTTKLRGGDRVARGGVESFYPANPEPPVVYQGTGGVRTDSFGRPDFGAAGWTKLYQSTWEEQTPPTHYGPPEYYTVFAFPGTGTALAPNQGLPEAANETIDYLDGTDNLKTPVPRDPMAYGRTQTWVRAYLFNHPFPGWRVWNDITWRREATSTNPFAGEVTAASVVYFPALDPYVPSPLSVRAEPSRVREPRMGTRPNAWSFSSYGSPPLVHVSAPPGRGTKEKKTIAQSQFIGAIFGVITEYSDLIDELWKALPKSRKSGYYLLHGKGGKTFYKYRHQVSLTQKQLDLWGGFPEIDINKAITGVVLNQIEDALIGKLGKGVQRASKKWLDMIGRPMGLSAGGMGRMKGYQTSDPDGSSSPFEGWDDALAEWLKGKE